MDLKYDIQAEKFGEEYFRKSSEILNLEARLIAYRNGYKEVQVPHLIEALQIIEQRALKERDWQSEAALAFGTLLGGVSATEVLTLFSTDRGNELGITFSIVTLMVSIAFITRGVLR